MEDAALGSLNAYPLILSTWRVLAVQLLPATILACKRRDRVANVGEREAAVQNKAKEAGRAIWALLLAGNLQEFLVNLFEHYKKAK